MESQKLERSHLLARETTTLFIQALNKGDSTVPGGLLSSSPLLLKTTKKNKEKKFNTLYLTEKGMYDF